jgi:hypothetical protein
MIQHGRSEVEQLKAALHKIWHIPRRSDGASEECWRIADEALIGGVYAARRDYRQPRLNVSKKPASEG